MNRIARRAFLAAGAGIAVFAAVPLLRNGTQDFLRRTVRDHFGDEAMAIDGVEDFIEEFAALTGDGDRVKQIVAEVYFTWRGDRLHMIGPAQGLRDRFLNTMLVRSNIIAALQEPDIGLSYTSVDPWDPTCGLYLSAFADDML